MAKPKLAGCQQSKNNQADSLHQPDAKTDQTHSKALDYAHGRRLARSDATAASLSSVGAEVHRGSLEDLESLRRGASAADGVIQTAFNTDFSKYAQSIEIERLAIEAIGETLVGSGRPLLVNSGVTSLAPGRVVTENVTRPAVSGSFSRAAQALAFSFAERGVKTGVIRLPAVHGPDDHIFIPVLVGIARKKGESAYLDEGLNRCPTVHQFDAARVYRLALERNVAGALYHAVAEEGVCSKIWPKRLALA